MLSTTLTGTEAAETAASAANCALEFPPEVALMVHVLRLPSLHGGPSHAPPALGSM